MIFATENAVEDILANKKTQTRRLVKEKDMDYGLWDSKIPTVFTNKGKIKWQVGKDYAVQLGRGKHGLLYIPHSKILHSPSDCDYCKDAGKQNCVPPAGNHGWMPLRIKITGIRKERLLDITEEDAKKEGFKAETFYSAYLAAKDNFLIKIGQLYGHSWRAGFKCFCGSDGSADDWNPEVWVLEFEVKQ